MATMFSPTAEEIWPVSSFRLMKYSCSAICFSLNLLTGVGSWLCFFFSCSECVREFVDTFGFATYLQSLGQPIMLHLRYMCHQAVVTICSCHRFFFLIIAFQKIANATTRHVRCQVCSSQGELSHLPMICPVNWMNQSELSSSTTVTSATINGSTI